MSPSGASEAGDERLSRAAMTLNSVPCSSDDGLPRSGPGDRRGGASPTSSCPDPDHLLRPPGPRLPVPGCLPTGPLAVGCPAGVRVGPRLAQGNAGHLGNRRRSSGSRRCPLPPPRHPAPAEAPALPPPPGTCPPAARRVACLAIRSASIGALVLLPDDLRGRREEVLMVQARARQEPLTPEPAPTHPVGFICRHDLQRTCRPAR